METVMENSFEKQQNSLHDYVNVEKCDVQKYQSSVKLPALDIPIYDGDKMRWREFWDFFKVTVDNDTKLTDTEKFIYLKGRLVGAAEECISGIPLSNENYSIAKALLTERFEDEQLVLHSHFTELMNLTPARNTTKGLRNTYDKIEMHLRCLEALKQDIDHGIFISIIISKIPKEVLLQLELQKGARSKWSASLLRKLFNNYICVLERVDQQSYYEKGESKTGSQLVMTTNEPRFRQRQGALHNVFVLCRYCGGNHWSDQCMKYPTAAIRKEKIKDSCFLCLKQGHIAYKCLSNKMCFYCGRKGHHNRSLCPKVFEEKKMADSLDKKNQQNVGDRSRTERNQRSESGQSLCFEPSKEKEMTFEKDLQNKTVKSIDHESTDSETSTKNLNKYTTNATAAYTQVVREKAYEQVQVDKADIDHSLSIDTAEIQAESKELYKRVASLTEKLLKLQTENKGLEAQIKDISDALANKHKLANSEMKSSNITTMRKVENFAGSLGNKVRGEEDFTQLKTHQGRTRPISVKETGWNVITKEDLFNFKIINNHLEMCLSPQQRFSNRVAGATYLGCGSVVEFPRI